MKATRLSSQARVRLDERFSEIGTPDRYTPPVHGWVKAIREALGISTTQLATRLGIRQPSVVAIEKSEARGTIELATLRRVAEALGCTVVYALVPTKPLEQTMRDRARLFVRRELGPVEHSMMLEDQRVKQRDIDAKIDEVLRETNPRRLWD